MRRILILTLLLCAASVLRAQRLDPTEYVYPIREVPGWCASNFGEIRPGHFHAGVDIKTDGVEGKPLVAVADGYISRAVLMAGGYGRAVYITLHNGKTAVYGHLQRFPEALERYVQAERKRRRSNNVDLSFGAERWPVRQGDLVGYSGNSGSSMGPHLHFELRDERTQLRYNLVREGLIRPEDRIPPRIMRLHYVEVDTVRGVPLRSAMSDHAVVRTAEGRYRLNHSEALATGRCGYFVVEVTDRRNGVYNSFGVWRVALFVDDEPRFEYRMDGFTYDQARCCDAVSCYPLQLVSRNECIRLARQAGAPDAFYPVAVERGVLRTERGERRRICIEVEDDSGNSSQLEFDVVGRDGQFHAADDPTATLLRHDRAGEVCVGDELRVHIPAGALYEPLFCHPGLTEQPAPVKGVVFLSPAYRLFDAPTPLRRAATVSIRHSIPLRMQIRAMVAVRNAKGSLLCAGGSYAEGAVTATTRTAGEVMIVADTLAPTVRPLFAEGADLTGNSTLRFSSADNFAGIASWSLHIDGAWVPCDRFPMRGTLVHQFDTPPSRRRHSVELTVTDGCGNTARWKGSFYR